MLMSRAFFPGIYLPFDTQIYVFGGSCGGADLDQCERYHSTLDKWKSIAALPHSKNGSAACYMEQSKNIYILGGNSLERGELS